MRDKSHEHRKIKDPHPKKSTSDKKETHEKGFLSKLKKHLVS